MKIPLRSLFMLTCLAANLFFTGKLIQAEEPQWLEFEGKTGPGVGKHIVLISGDDEYRSEEALPMLAKILATRHGFKCTVLFSLDPNTGEIKPDNHNNIPGMSALDSADMAILSLRFRELPDADMRHFVDFFQAGKPILGMRTSTHAFHYEKNKQSPFAKFGFNSGEWQGGFGQQVLGDTWVSHHGNHGSQSTRGVTNEKHADHPILKGVKDVWGPTDVYGITHLGDDAEILLHGQVLEGMKPSDKPVKGAQNEPMMPLFWTREYKTESGKVSKIVCTTMGASLDLESEGLRRMTVNSVYWALGMADKIPDESNVDYVGEYKPTMFGFGTYTKGLKPSHFK
jgi:hypothetical protein